MDYNSYGRPRASADRRKATGALGEQAAADLLAQQGYEIWERNWRCRTGELDIVAFKDQTIVIVEVRSRSTGALVFGSPAESVNWRKVKQVRETASVYLHQRGYGSRLVRFDVIAVWFDRSGKVVSTEHLVAAF